MKKIFVENNVDDNFVITGDNYHHLIRVNRLKVGDKLILSNNNIDYTAEIIYIDRDNAKIRICDALEAKEPYISVTLFASAIKKDKMEYIVQKSVELGVYKIVPMMTDYCQINRQNINTERLNKIALEAAKQCGRGFVPKVEEPIDFNVMTGIIRGFDLVIFAYERERSKNLKELLESVKMTDIKNIAIIVGCEGGFSINEANILKDAGVEAVSLGPRIMRADTASLAVLSAVMYEFNEWKL